MIIIITSEIIASRPTIDSYKHEYLCGFFRRKSDAYHPASHIDYINGSSMMSFPENETENNGKEDKILIENFYLRASYMYH